MHEQRVIKLNTSYTIPRRDDHVNSFPRISSSYGYWWTVVKVNLLRCNENRSYRCDLINLVCCDDTTNGNKQPQWWVFNHYSTTMCVIGSFHKNLIVFNHLSILNSLYLSRVSIVQFPYFVPFYYSSCHLFNLLLTLRSYSLWNNIGIVRTVKN